MRAVLVGVIFLGVLCAACGGGGSSSTATVPAANPTATAAQTTVNLAAHEPELRDAFIGFEKALLTGDAPGAYAYVGDDLKQKCSLQQFTLVLGIVKAFVGDVKDTDVNVDVTGVRYDAGKAYVTGKTSITGSDFSSDDTDTSDGYWVWEQGGWKVANDEAKPCENGLGASGTSTPRPTGPGTSRRDPTPLGSVVRSHDLEVNVTQVNLDATAEVLASQSFAKPPRAGFKYVLVGVHVRDVASGDESVSVSEGDFGMTGSNNVLYEPYDDKSSCGFVTPDRLQSELYPGGTADGNVCFQVPQDERDLVLVVSPVFTFNQGDRRYLALQ